MASYFRGNVIPEQPWEGHYAETVGITASMFRFMLAFFASVAVSALLRFIPTPTGEIMIEASWQVDS